MGTACSKGCPGIAKTLAVRTLAVVTGGTFSRLQFTPDLVPGDIVGTRIWRPSSESFDVELGPVFASTRARRRDQPGPGEGAVRAAGGHGRTAGVLGRSQLSDCPSPFLVLATQNPIESDGVYELPEAQRDRFLLKIDLGYPSGDRGAHDPGADERGPADATTGPHRRQVVDLQRRADQVFVHHACAEYAVRLVLATRDPAHTACPIWPRRCSSGSAPAPRWAW